MNNQTAYLIAEKEPEFPCWMWSPETTEQRWEYFDCWINEKSPVFWGWTHWSDSSTVPTLAPDAPKEDKPSLFDEGRAEGRMDPWAGTPQEGTPTPEDLKLSGKLFDEAHHYLGRFDEYQKCVGWLVKEYREHQLAALTSERDGFKKLLDERMAQEIPFKLECTQRRASLAAAEQKVGELEKENGGLALRVKYLAEHLENEKMVVRIKETALTAANSARDGAIKERDEAVIYSQEYIRKTDAFLSHKDEEIDQLRTQLTSALTELEAIKTAIKTGNITYIVDGGDFADHGWEKQITRNGEITALKDALIEIRDGLRSDGRVWVKIGVNERNGQDIREDGPRLKDYINKILL